MSPSNDSELIPIEDLSALIPNVFVAVDVSTGPWTEDQRVVGTVIGVHLGHLRLFKVSPGKEEPVTIEAGDIKKAYFAPMGYRP